MCIKLYAGTVHTYDYRDEIAQGACTAVKTGSDHIYAVRRQCSNLAASCESVCHNLGKQCFNAVHVYGRTALADSSTGEIGLHTYRYDSCSGTYCGPNFCCCSEKPSPAITFKDELAQSTCTALLPEKANHVYAVRRKCPQKAACNTICSHLGKTCFNSLHVYDAASIGYDETDKVGLHMYRYNSCTSAGCGPNFCCCSEN